MSAIAGSFQENTSAELEDYFIKMVWYEYRRFSRELVAHQLTFAQFHTLIAIKEHNPTCTMGFLADETNQVSATITGIVDRLVEQGLVERWRHPQDRRKVQVRLTEAGANRLEAVFKDRKHQIAGLFNELDEPTRHNLAFTLSRYIQALEDSVQADQALSAPA